MAGSGARPSVRVNSTGETPTGVVSDLSEVSRRRGRERERGWKRGWKRVASYVNFGYEYTEVAELFPVNLRELFA